MTATVRRTSRRVAVALLFLGVLAVAAPFIDAGQFREPLRRALERSLRRQVQLGELRYRTFPALGLTARNVVIAEDPEFGVDAAAYVDELGVELRWGALLQGRMEVAAVRLIDASVNLARNESGEWAFRRLLTRPLGEQSRNPRFLIQNGRINFRTGTMKSPFYLNSVDLELTDTGGGGLEWQYEASPARTDRAEQGFGRFSGSGKWQAGEGGGSVDIEMSLERSATAEVSMLLASRDVGLPGRVWSHARLFGRPSEVRVTGALQFEGLERSGLFPFRDTRLSIPYEGTVDVPGQKLVLATLAPKDANLPLSAEFQMANFLGSLTRQVVFRFDKMPAKSLLEISRRLGQTVPDGLAVEGEISGRITAGDQGVDGEIEVSGPTLRVRDLTPIEAESAEITIRNGEVLLAPVRVTSGDVEANLEGGWRTTDGALRFQGQVTNLPVPGIRAAARQLAGAKPFPPPWFGDSGRISGAVRYDSSLGDQPWSGDFILAGAKIEAYGFSGPLDIRRADVRLRGEQWSLRGVQGSAEDIAFGADYSRVPLAKRTDRMVLKIAEANASDVEDLLSPILARDRGLLERALRFRSDGLPPWLRTRRAEVRFAIETLHAGQHDAHAVKGTIFWDGPRAEIPDLSAEWAGAMFRGYLRVDMTAPQPQYFLKGQLEGLAYLEGQLDMDIDARGAGFGSALVASITGSADFRGRNVQLGDEQFRLAAGTVEVVGDRSGVKARLKSLELVTGSEVLQGQGVISPESRALVDVSNAKRSLRLSFDVGEGKGTGK